MEDFQNPEETNLQNNFLFLLSLLSLYFQTMNNHSMGLFTFYLQQMHPEPPTTSNKPNENQNNPTQIFLQLAEPSQEELEELPENIESKQTLKEKKSNQFRSKVLTKSIADREDKRKALSQVRGSEYSNTQILKNHLKDLTTLKNIVDKTNIHHSVPERYKTQKSTHKESALKGYDLNRNFNQIAKQLQQQVDKLRNNRKTSVGHSMITLVPPTSVCHLKKKGRVKRLPTLKKAFKELKKESKMHPIELKKKTISQKWKNPHKQKKQPFLQPLFSDRNQQCDREIEEMARGILEKRFH